MKKTILIIGVIIVAAGLFFIFFTRTEEPIENQNINIKVNSPAPNEVVKSQLQLTGEVRTWYFEGSFPVKILDANGKVLGNSYVMAQGDWMTTNFVAFKGEIDFTPSKTETGKIVFMKDNPSGLAEHDESFELPIKFDMTTGTQILKIYFNNNNLDPQISCNKVFPVEREVYKTDAPARRALELLLKGPAQDEINSGYLTSINSGVKIQSITIQNNVAKVDFDEQLENAVGGSCRVSAIRAQITETLKQFSSVKSVIISINGRTEDILQP